MRLRLKLALLLGFAFFFAGIGLFIYDTTIRGVDELVLNQAQPSAALPVTALAISVRSEEMFVLLAELSSVVAVDDVPNMLRVLGELDELQREREAILRGVRINVIENPELASLLRRRQQIIDEERLLLNGLADDLAAAGGGESRKKVIDSFMRGKYGDLEKERGARAEAISLLSIEQSGKSFDAIKDSLERGHNLYLAIIFTLLLSFVFVLFFVNKRVIWPVEQITQTIEQISMGKLDAEVPDELKKSTDEIGRLSRAFDRTIMSLKMSMRGQKEQGEVKKNRGK